MPPRAAFVSRTPVRFGIWEYLHISSFPNSFSHTLGMRSAEETLTAKWKQMMEQQGTQITPGSSARTIVQASQETSSKHLKETQSFMVKLAKRMRSAEDTLTAKWKQMMEQCLRKFHIISENEPRGRRSRLSRPILPSTDSTQFNCQVLENVDH